jgi:hypothetical protein
MGAATGATIRVKSHNPVVTREVWVTFGHAGHTTATVSGTASGVAAGAVADLYASAFPFKAPMSAVANVALSVSDGGTASYAFRVSPQLETRYRVEIFSTSSATSPEAVSTPATVYVAAWAAASNNEGCTPSTCTISINLTWILPATAIPTEKAKHQFFYLDLVSWRGGPAPKPTTYHLVAAKVSAPSVRGDHVHFRVTITYKRPAGFWYWFWESCTKDTVGKDGVGLAGAHHCGARSVSAKLPYLG